MKVTVEKLKRIDNGKLKTKLEEEYDVSQWFYDIVDRKYKNNNLLYCH